MVKIITDYLFAHGISNFKYESPKLTVFLSYDRVISYTFNFKEMDLMSINKKYYINRVLDDFLNTNMAIFVNDRNRNLNKLIRICKDKGYTWNLWGTKNQNDILTFNIEDRTYLLQDSILLIKNDKDILETKEYTIEHVNISEESIVFDTGETEIVIKL